MPADLAGYDAALKEVLLPYIRDSFPSETIVLDQVRKNAGVTRFNNEFIAPIWTGRHGGVSSLADDGNSIVSASGRTTSRATVPVEIHTAAFDITDLVMKASTGNNMAVAAALESQAKTLAKDFGRQMNRQVYGDGVGVVAEVSGSNGANNVEVRYPTASLDDGRSIDWYGTINNDLSATKYIAVGNVLGIGTGGADLGTVTAVNGGTSLTTTGSPGFAANDAVYIMDGSGEGAGTAEMLGIRAALSSSTGTSTYAGLARDTVGWTPSFGSASEALTLDRMTQRYVAAREYASGSDKYIILVNQTLYRKYGAILTAMRRTVNESQLLGGFTGLEFAAGGGVIGVFLDYDVPDGEVLVVNLDTWTLCQVGEIDTLSDGGDRGLLRLQNTLVYQTVMVWYANLLCLAPGANGRDTRKSA